MKKILGIIITFLLLPVVVQATIGSNSSLLDIEIYLFSNENTKSLEAEKWLDDIFSKYPRMRYTIVNVEDNKEKYNEIIKKLNISKNKYPLLVIGSNYFIDFNTDVKESVEEAINSYSKSDNYCNIMNTKLSAKDCKKENEDIYQQNTVNYLPLVIIILIVILGIVIRSIINKKRMIRRRSKSRQ